MLVRGPGITPGTMVRQPAGLQDFAPASDKDTAYRYHGIIAPLGGTTWKYVERSNGKTELYDLTGDPYELSNVSGRDRYLGVRVEMGELLQRYQWCAGRSCR
jgi:hypothetical protein